jgi:hypothetical protein
MPLNNHFKRCFLVVLEESFEQIAIATAGQGARVQASNKGADGVPRHGDPWGNGREVHTLYSVSRRRKVFKKIAGR